MTFLGRSQILYCPASKDRKNKKLGTHRRTGFRYLPKRIVAAHNPSGWSNPFSMIYTLGTKAFSKQSNSAGSEASDLSRSKTNQGFAFHRDAVEWALKKGMTWDSIYCHFPNVAPTHPRPSGPRSIK